MNRVLIIIFCLLNSSLALAQGRVKAVPAQKQNEVVAVALTELGSGPVDFFNGRPWEVRLEKDFGLKSQTYWKFLLKQDAAVYELWAESQHVISDGRKFSVSGDHMVPRQKFDLSGEQSVKPTQVEEAIAYRSCNLAPDMTETFFFRSYACDGKKVNYDDWCVGRQRMLNKTFTTESQVNLVFQSKGGAPITLPTKPTEYKRVQTSAQSRECEPIPKESTQKENL